MIKRLISCMGASLVLYSSFSHANPEPPAIHPPTDTQLYPESGKALKTTPKLKAIPTTEWLWHKTSDGQHPNGEEQVQVWLMNRARQNPTAEGIWLATETHPDVAGGRNYFGVNLDVLKNEFAAYPRKPPAAFDLRLYKAAKAHSEDMIRRNAQDHNNQFERVKAEGFQYTRLRGNVFSYADNGLNAHAGFNIDWGLGANGVQDGRGHRKAIQSLDADYTNVGIAAVAEGNAATQVGPMVVTSNFAQAYDNGPDHHNRFIIGTVWEDKNGNNRYDPGEGIQGVTVLPDNGTYFAVTSAGGGYAIPVTQAGTYQVNFSGGGVADTTKTTAVGSESVLLDYKKGATPPAPDPRTTVPALQLGQVETGHGITTVPLQSDLTDPVAILGPPSFRGRQPALASLTGLSATTLAFRAAEWNYLDGQHLVEAIPYLLMNAGQHAMPDGSVWEAGRFPIRGTGRWHSVNFSTSSGVTPLLFLTLQTRNGGQLVTIRARDLTSQSFRAALFEQESLMDGHIPEIAGYLAIFPETVPSVSQFAAQDNTPLNIRLQRTDVQDHFTSTALDALRLQEETSKDPETLHTTETADVLTINNRVFAQITSFSGGDTVSLRRRGSQ